MVLELIDRLRYIFYDQKQMSFLEEYLFNTPRIFSNSTFILSVYQDDEDKPTSVFTFQDATFKKACIMYFLGFFSETNVGIQKERNIFN